MATSLVVTPSHELVFKGPFTDVVTVPLQLENRSEAKLCFKVKTTAPKQYCVRPNSGTIAPGATVSVSVMLQPLDAHALDDAPRHKFMVQSCVAPAQSDDLEDVWKSVPQAELAYTKLRVVFGTSGATAAGKLDSLPATSAASAIGVGVRHRGGATQSEDAAGTPARANQSGGSLASDFSSPQNDDARLANLLKERDVARRELEDYKQKFLQQQRAAALGHHQDQDQLASSLPIIQIVLLVVAGLLVGLILGKTF